MVGVRAGCEQGRGDVVGFAGARRAGKSTAAQALVERRGFVLCAAEEGAIRALLARPEVRGVAVEVGSEEEAQTVRALGGVVVEVGGAGLANGGSVAELWDRVEAAVVG